MSLRRRIRTIASSSAGQTSRAKSTTMDAYEAVKKEMCGLAPHLAVGNWPLDSGALPAATRQSCGQHRRHGSVPRRLGVDSRRPEAQRAPDITRTGEGTDFDHD